MEINKEPQKKCSRCIHSESYPRINFDSEGVCNYCRYHEKVTKCDLDKLEDLFGKIKGKGKGKYDCLVPFSGGLDSTYVLYLMLKKYNLRPLAFNFNNGWQNPVARQNVQKAVKKLGCDLRQVDLDWDVLRRMYLAMMKAGVPEICGPCMVGIYSYMLRIAEQENIRLIVNGSFIRNQGSPPLNMFYVRDGRYYYDIITKYAPEVCDSNYCALTLKDYFRYFVVKRIKIINLPDYLPEWNDDKHTETLKAELDWEFPKGQKHRFDCLMYPIMLYWTQKKFGWNPKEMALAAQVRSGTITHDKALEMLAKNDVEPNLEAVLKALEITQAEFNKLVQNEPKTFLDYKNYYSFLLKLRPLIKLAVKLGFVQSIVYDYYFTH